MHPLTCVLQNRVPLHRYKDRSSLLYITPHDLPNLVFLSTATQARDSPRLGPGTRTCLGRSPPLPRVARAKSSRHHDRTRFRRGFPSTCLPCRAADRIRCAIGDHAMSRHPRLFAKPLPPPIVYPGTRRGLVREPIARGGGTPKGRASPTALGLFFWKWVSGNQDGNLHLLPTGPLPSRTQRGTNRTRALISMSRLDRVKRCGR